MDINLNNFKESTWVMLLLLFVFEICSSMLFIFSFQRDIFIQTDLIKLLLLGLSITLPIWLINCLIFVGFTTTSEPNNDHELQAVAAAGSGLTFPIIYVPIFIKFFWLINLKTGVIIAICLQLSIIIIWYLAEKFRNKKMKKEKGMQVL